MEEAHAERMLDGFETGGLRVPRETRDLKINERKVGKEKGGNNDEDMGAKSRKMGKTVNSVHEVNLEEGGMDNNVLYPCTKYCRYFTSATLSGADKP